MRQGCNDANTVLGYWYWYWLVLVLVGIGIGISIDIGIGIGIGIDINVIDIDPPSQKSNYKVLKNRLQIRIPRPRKLLIKLYKKIVTFSKWPIPEEKIKNL